MAGALFNLFLSRCGVSAGNWVRSISISTVLLFCFCFRGWLSSQCDFAAKWRVESREAEIHLKPAGTLKNQKCEKLGEERFREAKEAQVTTRPNRSDRKHGRYCVFSTNLHSLSILTDFTSFANYDPFSRHSMTYFSADTVENPSPRHLFHNWTIKATKANLPFPARCMAEGSPLFPFSHPIFTSAVRGFERILLLSPWKSNNDSAAKADHGPGNADIELFMYLYFARH